MMNDECDLTMDTLPNLEIMNATLPPGYVYDCSNETTTKEGFDTWSLSQVDLFVVITQVIIFLSGMIGNCLVIYVVSRFAKMKTVTNMYILNLAISDLVFLISIPFTIITQCLKYWWFGNAFCKIYFVFYSISFFGGVFTLTALSVDRYLAVCHAVKSQRYRKPKLASLIILGIWSVAFFVMLPTILYARTVPNDHFVGKLTCTIKWPQEQPIPTVSKAYIWYTFLLGFGIPVSLITVFYLLVIVKLKNIGPAKKSKERRKNHRRVTRMVLAVITVYVVCWLPYWGFQVNLTFNNFPSYAIIMFSIFTLLSYSNSMLNPILYAFLSENFRSSFMNAFRCKKMTDANRRLQTENSLLSRQRRSRDFSHRKNGIEETIEMQITHETFESIPEVSKEPNINTTENQESVVPFDATFESNTTTKNRLHNLIVNKNGTTELHLSYDDEPLQLLDKEIQTKINR